MVLKFLKIDSSTSKHIHAFHRKYIATDMGNKLYSVQIIQDEIFYMPKYWNSLTESVKLTLTFGERVFILAFLWILDLTLMRMWGTHTFFSWGGYLYNFLTTCLPLYHNFLFHVGNLYSLRPNSVFSFYKATI